jgi:hypothetical protein
MKKGGEGCVDTFMAPIQTLMLFAIDLTTGKPCAQKIP